MINMNDQSDVQLLTTRDVAKAPRTCPARVRRLARRGELAAFQIGSEWRFLRGDFEAWLIERSRAGRAGQKGGGSDAES